MLARSAPVQAAACAGAPAAAAGPVRRSWLPADAPRRRRRPTRAWLVRRRNVDRGRRRLAADARAVPWAKAFKPGPFGLGVALTAGAVVVACAPAAGR